MNPVEAALHEVDEAARKLRDATSRAGFALNHLTDARERLMEAHPGNPANAVRKLCTVHDAFLIDNGDSYDYCTASKVIETCEFKTVRILG